MPSHTPDEFASLLGLSKGIDAGPAKLFGPREGDKAAAIVRSGYQSEIAEPFWNELAASYLPSFFRTYFRAPFTITEKDEETSVSWVKMTEWARNLILIPACPCFVRDHPDEARSFYLILAERAANLPAWTYKNNTHFPAYFFPQFVPFVRVFAQILAVHLPKPALPPLNPREGVTNMAVNVSGRMPSVQSSIPAKNSQELFASAIVCVALGSDSVEEDMADFKAKVLGNASGTVWWGCEFAKGKAGMGGRECAKLGGGKDMMACGRCMAIRYCSREHQKAHWKIHKLSCFQPSWRTAKD